MSRLRTERADEAEALLSGGTDEVMEQIDVLAFPSTAPWLKVWESVDYLRAVNPRVAVPIHQGIVNDNGRGLFYGRYHDLAPEGTEFRVLPHEEDVEV